MQPIAEVDAICIPSYKSCTKVIEPLQSSFAHLIDKEHLLNVYDWSLSRTNALRNRQEFLNPVATKPALQDKYRSIFAILNRDS